MQQMSYVFILCPPYCGSTLIWKLLETSSAVAILPQEGQFIPEVKDVMLNGRWQLEKVMPWAMIKDVWHQYWDASKPYLVEKSPAHLMRVGDILEHFSPTKFILIVRNPYAHCEGLIRRNGWTPDQSAKFALMCLQKQRQNFDLLGHKAISFTYEDLVNNTSEVCSKIEAFLPGLGFLDFQQHFKLRSVDGFIERKIVDLNRKKIKNLSPDSIRGINCIFENRVDTLSYWGYELYKPSFRHRVDFEFNSAVMKIRNVQHRTISLGKRIYHKL